MTPQARIRRIGWFAILAVCTAFYLTLNFKVHTVSNQVIKAERRIVDLQNANMLLQTEFLSRASQTQLAAWNRLDFGYKAPDAQQFLTSERQLSQFAAARDANAPAPIQLASADSAQQAPPFPKLVSPLTGKPVDQALLDPRDRREHGLAVGIAGRTVNAGLDAPLRITLNAAMGAVDK